jgi:glycosyltransferase involved in cell wall biosynthesis/2-polyprenyl-3-methyl-5-hydroxy-6-metoxy-1,4-benzoquinol methylase
MDICTIIAKNYVAQARLLARSFIEHHTGGRCFVLAIDDYEGYIDPSAEPFSIVTPAEIGCNEFEQMALRYTVLELSTAVKPWLLAHLLSEGRPAITYLDPDIRIYGSLERLDEMARAHTVVLTPHNTVPLPDDGERPTQVDILLAGVYNLGYVSLGAGQETDTLLRWWRERLLSDCRVDPFNGYFVDQRWFDLAPGLVSDCAIVREPQYNLAYWNLHNRRLEHNGTSYTVDGEALAFFHFSGYDPKRPDVLSRHQTRIPIVAGSALERICREYAAGLDLAGHREASAWPYTYERLPSGVEYSRLLRHLYTDAVDCGELDDSPFTPAGSEAFMAWLGSPEPGGPRGVNRMLARIYKTRPDLQAAFTDLAHDPSGLLNWASKAGVVEEPMLGLLAPSESNGVADAGRADAVPGSEATVESAMRDPSWGVNVVGYFRSELGTGEAARQLVGALDAASVPLLPVHGRTIPPNRQGHAFTHLDYTDARYSVNLICINADVLSEFAEQAGREFFDGRHSIGMWFWEVEQFPAVWFHAFDHLNELWLPTEHILRAIGPVAPLPTTKITLPVEMPPVMPATRAELKLPEGFMFLFSFDHHSVFERKNPLAVIEAYKRAFAPNDEAALVIKSINAASAQEDHARLLAAAGNRPDVHIIDGYLSPEDKNLMVASCDCYVSLHRAEGFGLTMAEAMYLDKPVIATGYSGNLDFMTAQNSFLVDYRPVLIGPNADPYPEQACWADPDLEHAAQLMREVFDHPKQAAERGLCGGREIRRTHSAAAAGEIMRRRLALLHEQQGERVAKTATSKLPTLPAEQRIQAGPVTNSRPPMRRLRNIARRLVLRLIKPYTAYQQSVNMDMVQAVSALEARVHEFDRAATERHAAFLAELRSSGSERRLWERIGALTRSIIVLEHVVGKEIPRRLDEIPLRLDDITRSVRRMEWEDHAIPYMEGSPLVDIEHPLLGVVQGYHDHQHAEHSEVYRSFEDTFRGSEAVIRDRQRIFLELVSDHGPVLDFGCGRGEFLDLLKASGVPHIGVDADPGMVRRCRAKGHTEVVEGDGLAYLDTTEDGSLGAIFCAQVIEHLPYEQLIMLLELARAKLNQEGVFLAETVNPHCASALKTFWVDPTHQHPIFPEVALQLVRSTGFSSGFIFHPNGSGDVRQDRFAQGEYAVIAGGPLLLAPRIGGVTRRRAHDGEDRAALQPRLSGNGDPPPVDSSNTHATGTESREVGAQ